MPPGDVYLGTGTGKLAHFSRPRLLLEEQLVLSEKLSMAGRGQCKGNQRQWTPEATVLTAATS